MRSENISRSTRIPSSITVVQTFNDQCSIVDHMFRTWNKLPAPKLPFRSGRWIPTNRAIKLHILSFILSLFSRWYRDLWGRYWLSRTTWWSWHASRAWLSLVSFFPSRSNRSSHSWLSMPTWWTHNTLSSLFSSWSPPTTRSFYTSIARASGGTRRADFFGRLAILCRNELF